MMKKIGLLSCAALALAWALPALAELPRDVQLERLSATRIAVVWSGVHVADERYRIALTGSDQAVDVAGTTRCAELEHAPGVRPEPRTFGLVTIRL